MKAPDISVVIPVYNEKENLPELVHLLERTLKITRKSYEYIIVDDGSTDGSGEALSKLRKKIRRPFTILRFRKNQGKSAALSVGFARARGNAVVMLDADLQDEPKEIPKLLKELSRGYGLVVGWRKNRQDPSRKIFSSRLFNFFVSKIGKIELHDMNSGLKVFTREAAQSIDLYGELHRFIPLLVVNEGFAVTEVPVVHHTRKFGVSKFGANRGLHAAFDLVTTMFLMQFKRRPLHIFGPVGVTFTGAGILILLYLTILHFVGQKIGNRPALFFGILFVLSGIQIFLTGLIGELLLSLHDGKTQFPVEELMVQK